MAIIEAVLWDMDGVLVDSERLVQSIFVEIMNEAGVIENPEEFYLETIGFNHQSIIQHYQQAGMSREQAEYYCAEVGRQYKARIDSELELKAGVIEALQCVSDLGIPQMVVTSSTTETAQLKLSKFDVFHHFHSLLGGDQVTQGKPNPEPYLLACERLSIDPQRALVIEDSPNGVKSGLAAGAMVVHVPDLINTDPEWQDEIYHALDSLESFPAWLHSQRGGDWL